MRSGIFFFASAFRITSTIFSCFSANSISLFASVGAVRVIRLDGLLQRFEAATCVVKLRDGFDETLARKIDQQLLELPERLARLERLAGRVSTASNVRTPSTNTSVRQHSPSPFR
jgi:hypothetical protein